MHADLNRVPYTDAELAAIAEGVRIFSNVEEQVGPNDEDPGKFDFDDGVEVATKSFTDAIALQRYIFEGKTTRERIARAKYILDGVERAYGFIEGGSGSVPPT